jgi:cathepsin A (carboxypeptidase C)
MAVLALMGTLTITSSSPISSAAAREEIIPAEAADAIVPEATPDVDLEHRRTMWAKHAHKLQSRDKAMYNVLAQELDDSTSVQWERFARHISGIYVPDTKKDSKKSPSGHSWTSSSTGAQRHGSLRETSKDEAAVEAKQSGQALCDQDVVQHHGYFDIDKMATSDAQAKHSKNYFFWMFEARKNPKEAPLVLWLTGGPGCSSMLALLSENGPCSVAEGGDSTQSNPYSWNENANVIFVDQPAGTGFSYSPETEYDTDEAEVSEDLYHFMQEFIKTHPEYRKQDFHIFGESYAGHFVPATAHRIYEGNQKEDRSLEYIALQGFGIGNGLTDPEVQYEFYPEMAFRPGEGAAPVVNEAQYQQMKEAVPLCTQAIHNCQKDTDVCAQAMRNCNVALLVPVQQAGRNVYDLREECKHPPLCYDFSAVGQYLNSDRVRKVLGVDRKWKECNTEVNQMFKLDWMKNFDVKIPSMLKNGHTALIYAGDVDFICNWRGNKAWTQRLKWHGSKEFNDAEDQEWKVDGEVMGEVRHAEGLTFAKVHKAGHMVPQDQPKAALAMLNQFLLHKTLLVGAMAGAEEAKVAK